MASKDKIRTTVFLSDKAHDALVRIVNMTGYKQSELFEQFLIEGVGRLSPDGNRYENLQKLFGAIKEPEPE